MNARTTHHLGTVSLAPRLAQWIAHQHAQGVRVIGINGAQGCGKSTVASAIAAELATHHGLSAAVLALDDLYLPRAARLALARRVHPLLATRGVPGTHDVALGMQLLEQLLWLREGATLATPRFLKLTDDRAPPAQWRKFTGPVHVVLFEGWCVGAPAQAAGELAAPINALEAEEDADGRWRRWVNARLAGDYAPLFARLQRLVFLAAPNFECVLQWRLEQEATSAAQEHGHTMSRSETLRFIAHYERLTRHALLRLPFTADVVVQLGPQREIQSVMLKTVAGSA